MEGAPSPPPTVCLQTRQRIDVGDLVIVYEDFKNLHAVRVEPPKRFDCRFGSFPHADMIGRRFGERVSPASGRGGFVYLLSPSPELWTASLPHRTQILYIADISMIVLQLELQPGSVVIEAGTGSGSLSHALARAVGRTGRLHTFEFNAHRAQLAAAEFRDNNLSDRVTCKHGDVCSEGWTYESLELGSVDAAIFDLPQPWDAVRLAAPYVRPGGRLCTFSPCIEQIARTLDALPAAGFTGAEVVEVIVRTHEVRAASHQQDALALAVQQAEQTTARAQQSQPESERVMAEPTAAAGASLGTSGADSPSASLAPADACASEGTESEPHAKPSCVSFTNKHLSKASDT